MKNKVFHILAFLAVINLFQSCEQKEKVALEEPPIDWFFSQRAYPYGEIDTKTYLKALKAKEESELNRSASSAFDQQWTPVGPDNVGGRITDIEMWPDDLNTILAGSASGGIFRSKDQGVSWEPIFDEAASLAIGDIAIARSNPEVIYVGTGEANAGGGSLAYDGLGVYKSSDRGESWEHIGLEGVGSIGRVAIDPENENTVFVAAMGRLFGGNPERGIYRTNDGGVNWDQVLSISDTTGGIDLAIHPTNANIVYAAMWERSRRPNDIIYGGETSGLYRSKDGGDNWELLQNGLPTLPDTIGRIAIAIAPSNPNKVYAFIADKIGFTEGVYVSVDGGDSWNTLPIEGITDVFFQWWFSKLFVNPVNEDKIYLASFNMHQYAMGDETWSDMFSGVHVDQHALYVHPLDTSFIVNGNDGGIFISYDSGDNYLKSIDLPNMQFYTCEIDPSNTSTIYGGAQDNGTYKNESDNPNSWTRILGGEGMRMLVDPDSSDIIYCEFQNGNAFRSFDGGETLETIISSIDGDDRRNWNTPMALDYHEPNRIYYGTQRVWRSLDRGGDFEVISEDMTNGPYEGNRAFGTLTTIESSRVNAEIIYVGTDDGNVWNSLDNGKNWASLNIGMNNPRWTTAVLPDPIDEAVAYVCFSGFRYDSNDGSIYKTMDSGQTWIDITGDLPDIPINDIQVDLRNNELLFIATDIGVYYSENAGSSWQILGQGLPNVPVIDIDIEHDGKLVAATYGRSMYYYLIPEISAIGEYHFIDVKIFPNPTNDFVKLKIDSDANELMVEVYTFQGELLMKNLDVNENIPFKHLPKGVYLLSLKNGKGEIVFTEKIFNN